MWYDAEEDSARDLEQLSLSPSEPATEDALAPCIYLLYGLQLPKWDLAWIDHDMVSLPFSVGNPACLVVLSQHMCIKEFAHYPPAFTMLLSCDDIRVHIDVAVCLIVWPLGPHWPLIPVISSSSPLDWILQGQSSCEQEGPDPEQAFDTREKCLEAWQSLKPIILSRADDDKAVGYFEGEVLTSPCWPVELPLSLAYVGHGGINAILLILLPWSLWLTA